MAFAQAVCGTGHTPAWTMSAALGWDMGGVWAQQLLTGEGAGGVPATDCSSVNSTGTTAVNQQTRSHSHSVTLPKRTQKKERNKERGCKSPKLGKINLHKKPWETWQERVTLCHFAMRKNSPRFSIVCRFFSVRTEGWAQGELSGGKIEGIIEKMGLVHNWSDRALPTPSLWLKYARPPAQ